MIILPDKNIVRTKFIMPVPEFEWRDPSRAQEKDQLGNSVFRTSFRIRARLNDGFVKWTGWFESRDDFDAFLWAIFTGTLKYQKELWKLPTPQWHPDIGTDLSYDFATQRLITSTSASNQTDTVPSDWNSDNNTIETIGSGASGGASSSSGCVSSGGGAGAYSLISNLSLTKGGSVTFFLNSGGAGITGNRNSGNIGPNTWYNGTTVSNASVSAFGGAAGAGVAGITTAASAAGGTTGGVGTTKYAGGSSGSATVSGVFNAASGGGGAAGPAGNGGNSSNATNNNTNGGAANNGTTAGGIAGTTGSNGNTGTEFTTAGCGSGGGGGVSTGGSGGNYGGGGAGAANISATPTSGSGKQGIIVATYSPPSFGYNMPMLGM